MVRIEKSYGEIKSQETIKVTKITIMSDECRTKAIYATRGSESTDPATDLMSAREGFFVVNTIEGTRKYLNRRFVVEAERVQMVKVTYYLPFDNEHRVCYYEIPLDETYEFASKSNLVITPAYKFSY